MYRCTPAKHSQFHVTVSWTPNGAQAPAEQTSEEKKKELQEFIARFPANVAKSKQPPPRFLMSRRLTDSQARCKMCAAYGTNAHATGLAQNTVRTPPAA